MKIFTGQVIATKTQKTATVTVDRVIVHPVYQKRFTKSKKYQVHDEMGATTGQTVKFVACKPFSKTKKWKIIEIIDTAKTKEKKADKKKAKV